ncbi:MAG: MATE family efflux transporter [Lachnospiraceae bacterium]|jgi:multidrug efflux pump
MQSGSLEKYDQMPVSKAVVQNALPAIAAMLMTLIYNLADTFFIGQTHDAYQVAAVSLATPVFLIFMSLGTVFGAGGTSLISRAFGQRRPEYAKKICSFCMWCSIGIGTAMTVLLLVFMPQVLEIVGASDQTWRFTRTYLRIVAFCGPFSLISSGFSNILRAEGEANRAMIGPLFGIFYVITNALQAMGAAAAALIINVSRQGIIYIPMLFLLRYLFGIYGLAWAQPAADILSFGISILLYVRTLRQCMNRIPEKQAFEKA